MKQTTRQFFNSSTFQQNSHLTLFELNQMVREVIETSMPNEYWVETEISELREMGGHCYLELIQKDEHTNTPVAKASAKCWRSHWVTVRARFLHTTGQLPAKGMKVLLSVYAQFHENYGFSWIVTDIDPTFTLGDMAAKRREIVRQLKEEGVFDANRELALPMFCQRIAVISSANAAGYGDFCNQLADNPYGYQFHTALFASVMQGEGVEQGIVAALNAIFDQVDDFDCVVIARGGGATSDLSGFDTLVLARNVANFPLPVITGIGHDRDESVLDMISHTRVKTPTAAAAFLVDHLHHVDVALDDAAQRIARQVRSRMEHEQLRLGQLSVRIPSLFAVVKASQEARLERLLRRMSAALSVRITKERYLLENFHQALRPSLMRRMDKEKHRIEMLAQRTQALDPQLLLQRGYSITLHDGKAVRDASQLDPGDVIETRLSKGVIHSIVQPTSAESSQ